MQTFNIYIFSTARTNISRLERRSLVGWLRSQRDNKRNYYYLQSTEGTLIQEQVRNFVQVREKNETIAAALVQILARESTQKVKDGEIRKRKEKPRIEEKEVIILDKKIVTEIETEHVKKEFELCVPVSMAKIDKDKIQKETKPKSITELKQLPSKPESDKDLSTGEQEVLPTT